MSDGLEGAAPAPAVAPAPGAAAEPWQVRLEVLAILLLLAAAVTAVARLVTAYDSTTGFGPLDERSPDLVDVVRTAGLSVGVPLSGAVLVAFLLVTLGPGGVLGRSGVLALRGVVVVGLAVAGLAAFGGLAAIANVGSTDLFTGQSTVHGVASRLGYGAPALAGALLAGYVAWCAFAELGDTAPGPMIDPEGDLGQAAEGDWVPPPPASPA